METPILLPSLSSRKIMVRKIKFTRKFPLSSVALSPSMLLRSQSNWPGINEGDSLRVVIRAEAPIPEYAWTSSLHFELKPGEDITFFLTGRNPEKRFSDISAVSSNSLGKAIGILLIY